MVQDVCSTEPHPRYLQRHLAWLQRLAAALFLLLAFSTPRVNAQQTRSTAAAEATPAFEVAAIKPSKPGDRNHNWDGSSDRISIENYTLRRLISVAYDLKSELQVLGGPKWVEDQAFDITAKIDEVDVVNRHKMNRAERSHELNLMIQSLLADRFGLKVSHGERELPVFALVVMKSGAKIAPSSQQDSRSSQFSGHNGSITATHISMDEFAHNLGIFDEVGDRVVLNRTALAGNFDFKMDFTRDYGGGIPTDAQYPGLFTALKEQLGLELKPEKAPVQVVIVDAATEPVFD